MPFMESFENEGIHEIGHTSSLVQMWVAHMDEVGAIVRYVTPEGMVKFQPLGGWLDQALVDQRWIIMTNKGPVHRKSAAV